MKREPQALIYTILIEDKPIVAIEVRRSEARELCKEEWFLEELSVLKSNGEPLYRPGLRIRARPATEEEWVRYDEACSADALGHLPKKISRPEAIRRPGGLEAARK
jgi:hypothetical protein